MCSAHAREDQVTGLRVSPQVGGGGLGELLHAVAFHRTET